MSDTELDALQAQHLAYRAQLRREGVLVVNGPVGEQPDVAMRGLSIFACDIDEAKRLSDGDPSVQAGGSPTTSWSGGSWSDPVAFPDAHRPVGERRSCLTTERCTFRRARQPLLDRRREDDSVLGPDRAGGLGGRGGPATRPYGGSPQKMASSPMRFRRAVFGVLGVAFAVLLAFVMFLAFENYIRAREGASREAVAISELDRITRLFPAPQREELRNDLACYARAVVSDDGQGCAKAAKATGSLAGWHGSNRRSTRCRWTPLVPRSRSTIGSTRWPYAEKAAVHGWPKRRRPFPAPWLTLVLGAGLTIAYLVVFADRRERWTQAVMVGSITALIVAGLLVVSFLDRPYLKTVRTSPRPRWPRPCD